MISKLMLLEQKLFKQLIKDIPNVDVNIVKDVLQLDPTLKVDIITDDTEVGTYGEWLIKMIYDTYETLSDDNKQKLKIKLQHYDLILRSKKIPRLIQQKELEESNRKYQNIYNIKSINELFMLVDKIQGKTEESKNKSEDNSIEYDAATIPIINHKFKSVNGNPLKLLKQQYYGNIKEDGVIKWLVFNPKNMDQSKVAGYGTKWCTSRDDDENRWNRYIKEGNTAWIFLLSEEYKDTNPLEFEYLISCQFDKICIIVEMGQCQNRPNESFELRIIPEIRKFIEDRIDNWEIKLESPDVLEYGDINYILPGITNKNNRLQLLFNTDRLESIIFTLPEKDQQFFIYHFPYLKLIINGNTVRDEYIRQYKSGIRPSDILENLINRDMEIDEDIQLQQISSSDRYVFSTLINKKIIPARKVQLQQVKYSWDQILPLLQADITPDYDTQLQQVSQNGRQIRYILDHKIQVDKNVMMQQVSQDGYQIQDILIAELPVDEDIMKQQVSENGNQIRYISNPLEEIQLQQIKQNPEQYKFIDNPTSNQRQLYNQLKGITESTTYINKLLDVM